MFSKKESRGVHFVISSPSRRLRPSHIDALMVDGSRLVVRALWLSVWSALPSALHAQPQCGDTGGAILKVNGLEIYVGDTPLLEGVSFEVMMGERWGIVGGNGAGKSTLLRAIIGTQRIESGTALVRPGTSVGYLEQKGVSGSQKTVFEEAASQMERLKAAEAKLAALEKEVENAGENLTDEMLEGLVEVCLGTVVFFLVLSFLVLSHSNPPCHTPQSFPSLADIGV